MYLLGKYLVNKYLRNIKKTVFCYRFRHLATKMHFKSKSKSSSPERLVADENKSRRNSPVFPRKLSFVKTDNESNIQKK